MAMNMQRGGERGRMDHRRSNLGAAVLHESQRDGCGTADSMAGGVPQ